MPEATFATKRTNPRFLFSADAEATLPNGTSFAAEVFELSARGCYIDLIKPIPVGMGLNLRIRHGISTCELPAKVIYMQPGFGMGVYGMGVVFENVEPQHQATLESWLSSLSLEQTQKSAE